MPRKAIRAERDTEKLVLANIGILTVITVCFLALILTFNAQAESPDISLEGLDGKQHHLSEYIGNGKWVVLNIWGPGCPPCIEEMPDLENFADANKQRAIVVGMALDFPSFGYAKKDEVAAFVEDYFIEFPILLGDANIVEKFGGGQLVGTPTTFVYEPGGKLVARQVGQVTQQLIEDFINNYESTNATATEKSGN